MVLPPKRTDAQPLNGESININRTLLSNQMRNIWSVSLTMFNGFTNTRPYKEYINVSWEDVKNRICPETPLLLTDKKQGQFFIACILKEAPLVGKTHEIALSTGAATVGKMRSKGHVTETTLLVIDIDGLSEAEFQAVLDRLKADGISYVAYSTFSHGNPAKPGVRARIIIPLDRAINVDDYYLAWHGFDIHYLGGQAGKADASGANLYQQQGAWCCDKTRQFQAFKLSNDAGVASADALMTIGHSALPAKPVQENTVQKRDEFPPSNLNKVADLCNQIRMFRDNKGAGQSEPLWTDCVGVVGHCENGEEHCQLLSSGHQNYSKSETAKKLEQRLKYGPTTCNQFRKTNPDGCRDCVQKCKSPITLGWPKPDVPTKALKKNVDQKGSGQSFFEEVELHPDPVDPEILLVTISMIIQRHIVINAEQADGVALWIALTWLVDHVEVLPLLVINAPEKSCGKSQLLDLIALMSAKALPVSNISLAALFRTIDRWQPTILVDEADTFIRDKKELKGLINAGYTRSSAFVVRTVGDNFEPKPFNVWSAKAFAGIGLEKHFSDATMSRAIVINMRRKMPNEKVERIRHADHGHFRQIQSMLARFAIDYGQQVNQARPDLPEKLSDRAQDNWEPLLAIAECAGPEWVERARAAALMLSHVNGSSVSISNELLADIQQVFESEKVDKISSVDLITTLIKDEEAPWGTFNRGKPITPRQLAKYLDMYEIKSKTVRMQFGTPKGYDLGQFRDAFARYLTPPADSSQLVNLPQRRNVLPQPMSAMDSGVAAETQPFRNGTSTSETPQNGNRNNADTPEALPVLKCGVVADVAAKEEVQEFTSLDDF